MAPGRKFSTSTSEHSMRRQSTSLPRSLFMSSVTLFLLRLTERKYAA